MKKPPYAYGLLRRTSSHGYSHMFWALLLYCDVPCRAVPCCTIHAELLNDLGTLRGRAICPRLGTAGHGLSCPGCIVHGRGGSVLCRLSNTRRAIYRGVCLSFNLPAYTSAWFWRVWCGEKCATGLDPAATCLVNKNVACWGVSAWLMPLSRSTPAKRSQLNNLTTKTETETETRETVDAIEKIDTIRNRQRQHIPSLNV